MKKGCRIVGWSVPYTTYLPYGGQRRKSRTALIPALTLIFGRRPSFRVPWNYCRLNFGDLFGPIWGHDPHAGLELGSGEAQLKSKRIVRATLYSIGGAISECLT